MILLATKLSIISYFKTNEPGLKLKWSFWHWSLPVMTTIILSSHTAWNKWEPSLPGSCGSFPTPSCSQSFTLTQFSEPSELGRTKPRTLVSGWHCASLVNLHCMAMTVLFHWSCCVGLSETGSMSPPLGLSPSRGLTPFPTGRVQLPGFSFLRLLQPHPCLSPTGNTCGQWNMPRLHLHLGTPWECVVLMEHHLPDGAAAGAGFPEPAWEHSGLDQNLLPFLPLGILSLELSPLTCFFFYTPFYSHCCYLPGLVLPAHSDSCNGLLTTWGLASSTLCLFNQSKS